jgi:hypothetical protein
MQYVVMSIKKGTKLKKLLKLLMKQDCTCVREKDKKLQLERFTLWFSILSAVPNIRDGSDKAVSSSLGQSS